MYRDLQLQLLFQSHRVPFNKEALWYFFFFNKLLYLLETQKDLNALIVQETEQFHTRTRDKNTRHGSKCSKDSDIQINKPESKRRHKYSTSPKTC